jgi:hypothetical protein
VYRFRVLGFVLVIGAITAVAVLAGSAGRAVDPADTGASEQGTSAGIGSASVQQLRTSAQPASEQDVARALPKSVIPRLRYIPRPRPWKTRVTAAASGVYMGAFRVHTGTTVMNRHVWCDVLPGGGLGIAFRTGSTVFCFGRAYDAPGTGSAQQVLAAAWNQDRAGASGYHGRFISGTLNLASSTFTPEIVLHGSDSCRWVLYYIPGNEFPLRADPFVARPYPIAQTQGNPATGAYEAIFPRSARANNNSAVCGRWSTK